MARGLLLNTSVDKSALQRVPPTLKILAMQEILTSSPTDLTATALGLLAAQDQSALQALFDTMHRSDALQVLTSVPAAQCVELLDLMDPAQKSAALPALQESVLTQLLGAMDTSQLVSVIEPLSASNLAGLLDDLPDALQSTILESLDKDNLARLHTALDYPEGSAGRLMSTDALSVRPTATLRVVLRWLRRQDGLPPYTSALMVTDDNGKYLGKLPISVVVTGDPDTIVESVMQVSRETIRASSNEIDVAHLFDQRHLVAVPVIDDDDQLLGRITVDNAMTILRHEADRVLLNSAGLSDEADLFAPVLPSAKQRGVWLGINLITVFMAAWVIGQFQHALDQLVALAVLMPIVASMGGIAGSQTLTLTIRGMALDQIVSGNIRWLMTKEIAVGALNGAVWAIVVALATYFWFNNVGLSVVIATAMILNLLAAAASGVVVPLCLKRIGMDPALSGAVVLTTVTDIVGFLSFLGLASAFLL